MINRRELSKSFGIGKINQSASFGARSPYVLDLRKKIVSKNRLSRSARNRRSKSPSKKESIPEIDDAILQEQILRELANIERRDVELAASLNLGVVSPAISRDEVAVPPIAILARGLPMSLPVEEYTAKDALISHFFEKHKSEHKSEPPESSHVNTAISIKKSNQESFGRYISKTRAFVLISALLTGFLFGGFFVNHGLAVKKQTLEKGFAAYQNIASAKTAFEGLHFSEAGKDFSKAYASLVSAEEELSKIGEATVAIVRNIPFESRADSSLALLTAAKHIAKAGEFLSSAFSLLPMEDAVSAGAFLKVFFGDGKDTQAEYLIDVFGVFQDKLASADSELIFAERAMSLVRTEDFPEEFRKNISDLQQKVPALSDIVNVAKDYSAISSLLLGSKSPKKYLILFQNSSELRATGGFIGTYALIELDNGGLKNIAVEGIYEADGQLTVTIVPPKQFQHIATSWSTHDANWFLDFPKSAQKVAWFFERTGNSKIDGVITLNIEIVERLLALTGAIEIKEYGLSLDASNFRDEIQYEVEAAYDKKLNKPKKVIADFTPLFLERLMELSKERSKDLIAVLMSALEEKYIMLYFKEREVQDFFDSQGWSGKIAESEGDYLAVAYSNIGGYKTDRYIEDKVNYSVEIQDDGSLISNAVIMRKHNGGSSKYWWYNRKNISYVKIYVPKGAELTVSSGGLRREPDGPDYEELGFTHDSDIFDTEKNAKHIGPVDIFEESGKTVFGTWIVIDPKTSKELKISYKLPFRVEFDKGAGKYNLYWQKQPGTNMQASFAMNKPNDWNIVWSNGENFDSRQIFALDKDRIIGYIFSK